MGDLPRDWAKSCPELNSGLYPYAGTSDPLHQPCRVADFLLLSTWLASVDAAYVFQTQMMQFY